MCAVRAYVHTVSLFTYYQSTHILSVYAHTVSLCTYNQSMYILSVYVYTVSPRTYCSLYSIILFSQRTYYQSTYILSVYAHTVSLRIYCQSTHILSVYAHTVSLRTYCWSCSSSQQAGTVLWYMWKVYDWISSYLKERSQTVHYQSSNSTRRVLKYYLRLEEMYIYFFELRCRRATRLDSTGLANWTDDWYLRPRPAM